MCEFEGVPVQFLPVFNALLEESLREAIDVPHEEVTTRVLTAEHLLAVCLQTGRAKDRDRVRLLREEAELAPAYLQTTRERHQLLEKWKQ